MNNNQLAVPIAIIIAGALIAGAFIFTNSNSPQTANDGTTPQQITGKKIRGVQPDDHILGNPEAKVVIVEYSDTECPFCKNYHETLTRVINEYGDSGDVAWVYRHFPLVQLHAKAPKEAEALECAAKLGGNDGFWKYTNRLYQITPSNDGLDLAKLPEIAQETGLDTAAFTACLNSGEMADKVQEDLSEVTAAGGRGTPHSVVLSGDEQIVIEGGQPYEVVKQIIDTLLAN